MYLWRCVMTDEQEIIPLEDERKLSYLLRHHKELQPEVIKWATQMLTEARKDWADMRATSIETIISLDRRKEAKRRASIKDEKYIPFREYFKKVQHKKFIEYQKHGKVLIASDFVRYFLKNKAKLKDIPYKNTNLENKLRSLAQANNREFKKASA